MTKEDQTNIKEAIADEGFLYTFESYSDFEEVKDEAFHRRRTAFLDAKQALQAYIDNPTITEGEA